MVSLFGWCRRKAVDAPTLTPRTEPRASIRAATGLTHTLAPDRRTYLGRAAYCQLVGFHSLSAAGALAPAMVTREAISLVAAEALSKHHALTAELMRARIDPAQAMDEYRAEVDAFAARVRSSDWREALLSSYLCEGVIGDLFIALAPSFGSDGARFAAIFADEQGSTVLVETLREEISADPLLAARLALWGRRLIGDALLLARHTLKLPDDVDQAEIRANAAVSELVTAHTRRMDALGLTA